MIIEYFEQRTPEWFAARLGIPTASRFGEILTPGGAPSKSAEAYLWELVTERIKQRVKKGYSGPAMKHGEESEPDSIECFEQAKGVEVHSVGLCYPDEEKRYSCSPDGIILLDPDGCMESPLNEGLEAKNPELRTQYKYLKNGVLPGKYIPQIQGSLLVTSFSAWNFISHEESLPPLILRVERDEGYISKLREALDKFCFDLARTVVELRRLAA